MQRPTAPSPSELAAVCQLVYASPESGVVLGAARLAANACQVTLADLLRGNGTAAALARVIVCYVLVRMQRLRPALLAERLQCDVRSVRRSVLRGDVLLAAPNRYPQDAPLLQRVQTEFATIIQIAG